jgi:hypothetical protein
MNGMIRISLGKTLMLKLSNWLVLTFGLAFSFSIGAALAVDPSAPVGDFGSDSQSIQRWPIRVEHRHGSPRHDEKQKDIPAPAELAGRWMVFKKQRAGDTDVLRNDADVLPAKGGSEWIFVNERAGNWTVTEEGATFPLIVDKVEGKTMFARFQSSHERHALVLSFVNKNRLDGLERTILVDKDGSVLERTILVNKDGRVLREGKLTFALVGRRIEDPEQTKSP